MNIPLGFEVGSGRAVEIPLGHLAVTGQTQLSGKTSTLEALIKRAELCAVAFVTKRGEGSFRTAQSIAPYFREPTVSNETPMWKWVASILEATQGEKMGKERAEIIRASRGARSLEDVHDNIRKLMKTVRSGFRQDMCTCLDAYFSIVLPQIKRLPKSKTFAPLPGLNVMDLEQYTDELQALVIRSVIESVYRERKNTIVIIPEAAKFIPRARSSPVRLAAEMLIRQGLGIGNCVWLDSQDLANVATEVLKSVGVWLLGKQNELNEVRRVVNYIPAHPKVPEMQIQQLGLGQFYVVFGREVRKVYVQPEWLNELDARAIALGEDTVESALRVMREKDRAAAARRSAAPARGIVGKVAQALNGAVNAYFGGCEPTPTGATEEAIEEEEAMWKEKYDELKSEHEDLIQAHDALAEEVKHLREVAGPRANWENRQIKRVRAPVPVPVPDAEGESVASESTPDSSRPPTFDGDLETVYAYVRQRAQEDPGVIELLTQRPELRVRVERPVVEFHGNQLDGRIAQLIADGFFAQPRDRQAVGVELKRRGVLKATSNLKILSPFLSKLSKLGFLTVEAQGYQVVPGMNVQILEGKES